MPLYDFVCKACSIQFEEMSSNDNCPPCPQCQGETSRQLCAPHLKTGAMPYKPMPNPRPLPQNSCHGTRGSSCSGIV